MANDKWSAVVVVILKDEASYIEAWLAFYLALGFEHFFIYDNGSSDGIADVLLKYINGGVVTLISWPVRGGQIDAYNHALALLSQKTEWIGFFDVDEYLVLHDHDAIGSYLASIDADQILFPWRNFSYGGHMSAPGGSDIENYVWANRVQGGFVQVKHMVKPMVAVRVHAHFSHITSEKTISADGTPTPGANTIVNPTYKGAQINHYSTRSLYENELRLKKGQVNGGAGKKVADFIPLNTEYCASLDCDTSILRHFQRFSRSRESWARLAPIQHRYALMQSRNLLSSWNNFVVFFCKSFLNYLAGMPQIMDGTSLEPIYVDAKGGEYNLRHFWGGDEMQSVHFRVDWESFIPCFMGSVHYGDFVRRFGFEARYMGRDFSVSDTWAFRYDCYGRCLAGIFHIESTDGVRFTAESGPNRIVDYTVPPGHHAGLIYRPAYLLDHAELTYTISGECRVKELILGALP